ncbi:DUF2179 domain-containing protein [Mesotoga prima]|uniref:DUF2179 domain-containing protein n=1 Tax=Mesotoga prima TaxID=1184387 RepID=UPI002B80CD9A|nr:DUF2179 domain-containing protein [Mesotoga prima]HUM22260.1 DUF2179 domain-containing protein [Mesotoga prima]
MEEFLSGDLFKWVIMPLIIFFARIVDVSLGTTRIIMVSRGKKEIASLIGFFEVIVWLLVASKVIQSVDNVLYILAYAGGFAAGSYIGILIDERLAMGTVSIRLITSVEPTELINKLCQAGFGVTKIDAQGSRGKAYIIYSIINRKEVSEFERIAQECVPKAFMSVEDIRKVREGIFLPRDTLRIRRESPLRKSK